MKVTIEDGGGIPATVYDLDASWQSTLTDGLPRDSEGSVTGRKIELVCSCQLPTLSDLQRPGKASDYRQVVFAVEDEQRPSS